MTGGVNCGGGHRILLTIVGVCSRRPLPLYISVGGEERQLRGAPQVGGVLLGFLVGFTPFPFNGGGKGGGEREGEGKGGRRPLP